jgi:putative endonuclease
MKSYYVYILANKSNSVLYIGVTNNLERRLYEHKNKIIKGFTSKYNLQKLVYFEVFNEASLSIAREKQLKGWLREKKNALISSVNPDWRDLSLDWYGDSSLRSE